MGLDHPLRLVLSLAVAVALAFLYSYLARRKTMHDLAYSNLAFFTSAVQPRAWVPRALHAAWIVGLLALAVALGGPRIPAPVPARDGSVFICIDTSGSMSTSDVVPTRAAAALTAARTFIDESPTGTRIGLISFSGTATMVQPLSPNHAAVDAALAQIPAPDGATAIGDALRLAASSFPPTGHRVVILITDGVNNAGIDPQQEAEMLGEQHIPVYTIGIGTENGGFIPGSSDEATIDEGALESYAQVSGGAYARASNATELRDALAHLGRVVSFEWRRVDASEGFAIAGGLILLVSFLVGFATGRVT